MTTILLFHHARGQTRGLLESAQDPRDAADTEHAPDLFGGNTFESLDDGIAYDEQAATLLMQRTLRFLEQVG